MFRMRFTMTRIFARSLSRRVQSMVQFVPTAWGEAGSQGHTFAPLAAR